MTLPPFSEYPRDLAGYGRDAPHPRWPGDARVAVQFVINFEEGGENSILHGDAASEAFLVDVLGAKPWPGQRHMNVESMFEYGSRAGFWRLWRLFTARNIPVTVFGVATALARNPQIVAAMREAGWDIASHGAALDRIQGLLRPTRNAPICARRSAFIPKLPGNGRWAGTPGAPPKTRSSSCSTTAAFCIRRIPMPTTCPIGCGERKGPHLIIPYSLDANDMRFINPQGFPNGEAFFVYLRDTFDYLYEEGASRRK